MLSAIHKILDYARNWYFSPWVQDIDGLGAAGKLVKVNHGYARNFLVPNRLAAVRRGKQSGSVSGMDNAAATPEAAAARPSVPSSALSKEERKQLQLEQERRQLAVVIKKLTTQTLVSIKNSNSASLEAFKWVIYI